MAQLHLCNQFFFSEDQEVTKEKGIVTRLGTLSDFDKTNNVIKYHKVLKEKVLSILLELSNESEDLVIEKIDKEMITTGASILGRGTVIGFGTASLFLLSTPIGVSGKFQAKYSCYICSYSNMFP